MEQEKSLAKTSEVKLPKFVEQAYDSIEGMKQFANMLLESKLVPDSYYEKGPDNKPDYNKGKTSAVVVVLLQAQQLAVPPMTALQHIVPVNGLLSIKGDLAKTMIFASGKLRKDSWKEVVTGTIEEENMMVTISATRDDNGVSLTRSFSVDKAKRMGLWITPAMAGGTDGWKYKKSAWYKTPDRMIMYRCLGNIARDLFSDVLLNMYTTEEAVDIERDTTEIIETADGAKITIPDKEHAQRRSGKMTERVSEKIPDNKFGAVKDNIQEAEIVPEIKKEEPVQATRGSVSMMNGEVIEKTDNSAEIKGQNPEVKEESHTGKYSLKDLEAMDTKVLLEMVNKDTDMIEASEMIGGKNTNKKLREIVFASQEGKLAEHVAKNMPKENSGDAPGNQDEPKDIFTSPEQKDEIQQGNVPVNKGFDSQGPRKDSNDDFLSGDKKIEKKAEERAGTASNKYGIVIPELDKGNARDFSSTKDLFNRLASVTPSINAPRYTELAGKMGILEQYQDKEMFAKNAPVELVNKLLDLN